MLKTVDLEKRYRGKKKSSFHALKGINLEFGNKGLVFILGKSGSGKSTLLNILGGLDKFDSGDIILKGKSFKEFKNKDWDSYRNTYLGFVFQEYYLIENYTIEKNIKMALELQSYPKDEMDKRLNDILTKVDLLEVAKRKPNQLSGGQKQRIAIARALVKDPDIILADEPTGNLDSQTGEQIFSILKELSKEKLVIVVSHDKESASLYADRTITIKDGKITGDKFSNKDQKLITSEVDYYKTKGELKETIRIPKGEAISEDKLKELNEEVIKDDKVVYLPISAGKPLSEEQRELINNYLKTANEDVYIPLVKDLDKIEAVSEEDKINIAEESLHDKEEGKFSLIKSNLPFKYSLKMALSSLFRKKIKLIVTLILFTASLTFFGFTETVTKFDMEKALATSYDEAGYANIAVQKIKRGEFFMQTPIQISNSEIDEIFKKYSDISYMKTNSFQNLVVILPENEHKEFVAGYNEIKDLEEFDLTLVEGNLPVDLEEMLITDYLANHIIENTDEYNSLTDLIGYEINVENNIYQVSGILKTDYKDFDDLKDATDKELNTTLKTKKMKYQNNVMRVYRTVFVKEGFYENYINNITEYKDQIDFSYYNEKEEIDYYLTGEIIKYSSDINGKLLLKNDFKNLNQGELIISDKTLMRIYPDSKEEITTILTGEKTISEKYEELKDKGYLDKEITISHLDYSKGYEPIYEEYKLVGLYLTTDEEEKGLILAAPDFKRFIDLDENKTSRLLLNLSADADYNREFFNELSSRDIVHQNEIAFNLQTFEDFKEGIQKIFNIISIVFAVFSVILLYTIISSSVLNKKKEIGTLRAIGASGGDVAEIFITEAMMIGLTTLTFALIALNWITNYVNDEVTGQLNMDLYLFNLTPLILGELLLLAITISTVAAFIPVKKVASMKPINAIKSN